MACRAIAIEPLQLKWQEAFSGEKEDLSLHSSTECCLFGHGSMLGMERVPAVSLRLKTFGLRRAWPPPNCALRFLTRG
ncbi:BQ5605_C021g09376 [Microbotryum silenes-dioicae]|uniref:BQ5605_C021g09376 protein n=1 Tax=Microbotryum silenes-dioicae TaxID=796604 RepID=A0A2X0PK39_9BASI|nr:BQ5605_C021g09376 [Microbotryum silenes-dioicae]